MMAAEVIAEPDKGVRFIAAELVRTQPSLSANDAVERAVSELRARGAEPTFAGICSARAAALDAHRLRVARAADDDCGDDAATPVPARNNLLGLRLARIGGAVVALPEPSARYHPVTGTLDLRPRLASVDFDPNATFRPPSWLVKGVFPHQGIALVVGESGAGKTFLAIHTALSIAWGLPFFGRRARQGGVLYVAAEGGSSVLPRLRAADSALGAAVASQRLTGSTPACAPLRIVTEAPNLSREGKPVALIATIEDAAADFAALGSRLALVVIDTWHAAMGGGDENSAADAGAALAPLREAAEAHGALVLVIHHSGKDAERGARGSSALPAAADAIISLSVPGHGGPVAKPSDALRAGVVTKVRDGEAGEQLKYRLPIVLLGEDEDGDPWTTCVVEPVTLSPTDDDGLTKVDREFMEALSAALTESSNERANVQEVRLRFYALRRSVKPDANRKAFRRALEAAVSAARVAVDEGEHWLWLTC